MLPATIAVRTAENDELHEVETKYIFGNFTVGSSTGIEGEKAFEPETEAHHGTLFHRRTQSYLTQTLGCGRHYRRRACRMRRRDVAYWHKADMARCPSDVRFWG